MAIIWNNAMSVGNDLIDHDHHFMINMVNTIELLLLNSNHSDQILTMFDHLYEYSLNHFRREESIQRKISYPKSIQHKNSHKKLLAELISIKNELILDKSAESILAKSDKIVKFLRDWLINHVLNEDLLLKPYLEKLPKAFS